MYPMFDLLGRLAGFECLVGLRWLLFALSRARPNMSGSLSLSLALLLSLLLSLSLAVCLYRYRIISLCLSLYLPIEGGFLNSLSFRLLSCS